MPKKDSNWILEFIKSHSDRPMKVKELAQATGIKSHDYPAFRRAVKNLIDSGELVILKRNRVGLPDQMDLVTGTIAVTRAGFGFLKCDNKDEEIYIAARDMATALNGDRVMARLKSGTGFKGKREGVIIKVVERRTAELVGIYHKGRNYDYVVPDAKNVNRDIYILKGKTKKAQDGEKVVVRLHDWTDPYLNPEGEIVERLGQPGDPGVDMLAIIRQFNLPTEFAPAVEKEAVEVSSGWEAEFENRRDLTGLSLFTIDPVDAKDHDDAVSIEMVDGRYRLGVHIADVSHFVRPGTKLDAEAFARGTSVYFPDRVIPMLPETLSTDVCSLRPNKKRLAYSILIDFDQQGEVAGYELFPSVIKSRAKLTYEVVQEVFDWTDKQAEGTKPSDVENALTPAVARAVDDLRVMRQLARILYARRSAAGSLDFDLPEAKITLDKQGNVVEIGNRVRTESHRLIEEFMLAANRQVALHFFRNAQPTLYRVHDRPDMEKLEAFSYLIGQMGYRFPVSPNMPSRDFCDLLDRVKGKPEEELINELLLRSLKKAVYQPENIGHFGLAFAHYLHFTSPIRRYPDLLVHRLLRQLKNGRFPAKTAQYVISILPNVGKHSSDRERLAMEAEREAVKAKQVAYMARQVGSEYDGIISGVVNFGFFVRLIGPECEGLVRASSIDDDYYQFDEAGWRLVGRRKGKIFRLGDKIRVGVMKVDVEAREVDLFLPKQPDKTVAESGRKTSKKKKR